MNKKNTMRLVSVAVTGALIAGTGYWYQASKQPEEKVLRKLKYVEPVTRNPLKDKQASNPECADKRMHSLRLKRDGALLWKKTHSEFFAMEAVLTIDEQRLKGSKEVMPLAALLQGQGDIQSIDFISCGGAIEINLPMADITQSPDDYFLGLSGKGWMKLIKREDVKKQRFKTLAKVVTDIDLKSN